MPVHPHARGEHLVVDAVDGGHVGSSPRSWGTPRHRRRDAGDKRFIPTLVGNTLARGVAV